MCIMGNESLKRSLSRSKFMIPAADVDVDADSLLTSEYLIHQKSHQVEDEKEACRHQQHHQYQRGKASTTSSCHQSWSCCPVETLMIIAELLHPIEVARLSLASKSLLIDMECTAAFLYSKLPLAQLEAGIQEKASNGAGSWRYRYLCATEVGLVENEKLKMALSQIYAKQPAAEQLNLYGLHMGDEGVEHLALALRVVKSHKVGLINLSGNDISDKGAQAILTALQGSHDEVSSIFLAQNRIGANGARCVADLISHSHNLRSLSLSDNPITDEGADVISDALYESTSLSTLSMRCMSVSASAREQIRSTWGGRGSNSILGLYL